MDNYVDPYEKINDDRKPESGDMESAVFPLRLIAGLIDGLILCLVIYLLLTVVFSAIVSSVGLSSASEGTGWNLSLALFVWLCVLFATAFFVPWVYFTFFECSPYMATPGKLLLGLKVTDEKGDTISYLQSSSRYFGKVLTNVALCIGFLSILFSKNQQSIYDKIAGTYVVKK